MKVGTRMTAATSAVVVLLLGIWVALDFRSERKERLDALQKNVEDVALALRLQLESAKSIPQPRVQAERMSKVVSPLRVHISALPTQSPNLAGVETKRSNQEQRVKMFVDGHRSNILVINDNEVLFSLPLRTDTPTGFAIFGAIEVSSELTALEQALYRDLRNTLWLLLGITAVILLAVLTLIRSLVSIPIAKLLTGVNDVARGDLSRVLLAEREDEIGELAARFNEMTFSLRESRSETKRHNETHAALEQRLFQTEKLVTIGQIAAEIAHEVGTPLNVISGRAKGILKRVRDPEIVHKNANIIAEQTARITRIIQRLLDFSRRKVGEDILQPVNLNLLSLNTMEFLESKLTAAKVKHTLNRAEGLPCINGNPDQILQVLTNLVLNATEAMSAEGGGKLAIETAKVTRRRPGLEIASQIAAVVVSVSDTGPGILQEDREKIFEPFYSSKTSQGGTGLGLAVVHGIIKAHDGWIEVSSSPGGGSCFSVYLPVADVTTRP